MRAKNEKDSVLPGVGARVFNIAWFHQCFSRNRVAAVRPSRQILDPAAIAAEWSPSGVDRLSAAEHAQDRHETFYLVAPDCFLSGGRGSRFSSGRVPVECYEVNKSGGILRVFVFSRLHFVGPFRSVCGWLQTGRPVAVDLKGGGVPVARVGQT
jgi:hypothetical protein